MVWLLGFSSAWWCSGFSCHAMCAGIGRRPFWGFPEGGTMRAYACWACLSYNTAVPFLWWLPRQFSFAWCSALEDLFMRQVVSVIWDPQPRASVRGSSSGGGRAQVSDLEQKGKTLVWPPGPWLVISALWVLSGCLVLAANYCFGSPFLGAVRGGTRVRSSLTSWHVQHSGWFCLWALDLVEVEVAVPGGETSLSLGCLVSLGVTPVNTCPISGQPVDSYNHVIAFHGHTYQDIDMEFNPCVCDYLLDLNPGFYPNLTLV
ncbi:hypothetical protein Taro_000199 [Colocasia esculenta]|uniref:Uncharacterized protein n=1 Tax=Colocasia esculenta TaxID=4460 RepID=A0A843TEG8_COLES|nr:hypothetical protein [Colocasia esculenta]